MRVGKIPTLIKIFPYFVKQVWLCIPLSRVLFCCQLLLALLTAINMDTCWNRDINSDDVFNGMSIRSGDGNWSLPFVMNLMHILVNGAVV